MSHEYSKVLVSGGAGFIGSHIVDQLIKERMEVIVLDNLERGYLENIKLHMCGGNLTFVRGDVRDYRLVEELVEDVDAIIHLAALTSVPESFKDPFMYNDVNVVGTLNFLKASLNSDVRRFIYASSCAVYGNPKKLPIKESHSLHPKSPYGIGKIAAEYYLHLYFEMFGVKTVCLRYFNVYGPRQVCNQYSGVIIQFLNCLRENRSLVIFGDGEQTRDFVHVQDVVKATMLGLARSNAAGEVFNVGTGEATTINHVAKTLLEIFGNRDSKVVHSKSREGDIRHSVADISKAKKVLLYAPEVTWQEGLKNVARSHCSMI